MESSLSGEKKINPYERGPLLERDDFLNLENPVHEFQIYRKAFASREIIFDGYFDHFEDEAGMPVEDVDKIFYIVAKKRTENSQVGEMVLESVYNNTFVAGWDDEHYWLEIDGLFNNILYVPCRPL